MGDIPILYRKLARLVEDADQGLGHALKSRETDRRIAGTLRYTKDEIRQALKEMPLFRKR